MDRRTFLAAAPSTVLAGAVAAEAVTVTPVARIFHEWRDLRDFMEGPQGQALADEAFEVLTTRRFDLEAEIMAVEARTAQDFIMQVTAATSYGECALQDRDANPDFWCAAVSMLN